jgi:hypothetical protein
MLHGFWITLSVSLTLVACGQTPSAGPAFPALPSGKITHIVFGWTTATRSLS